MIIRGYSCKRFAGIADKNVEFGEGMNVVLGPNEAGKSTIVEGMYSVLFKPSNIGNKKTSDKEFRSRFMPLSSGDSIDGKLVISSGEGDYEVKKEWGAVMSSELLLPDSGIVREESVIERVLGGILGFGEGTYRSIVFSNQKLIKSAIENIIKNREATDEVGSLLRKAIMELDGISLDDLGRKIDMEIKSLTGRWDMDKEYPENNRGINNPYSNGLGHIVTHFYKKENISREMQSALEIETKTDKIVSEIEETEKEVLQMKRKKESMSEMEQDVHTRMVLEPRLESLKREMAALVETSREWPKKELRLEQLEGEISELKKKRSELEKEKEKAGKVQEKRILERRLERIEEIEKKVLESEKAAGSMKDVSKKDIEDIDRISHEIATAKAKMEAGKMFAKASGIKSGIRLFATTDLNEPSELIEGEEINANGY
ncbi:MAG TPA: AAA family ATPase, partial [Clostridia bacterium]|nr:AAA family ATPase [Clostridia bacterium]